MSVAAVTSLAMVMGLSAGGPGFDLRPLDPPPLPPGGYYGIGDAPDPPPPDGERAILTGAITFPIGLIRLVVGYSQVVLASPQRCSQNASTCQSLQTYGYVGTSMGLAMTLTGIGFLSIGLVRRSRYRRWKAARNLSWVPTATPSSAGFSAAFRF